MKYKTLEIELKHKIYIGGYETIEPTVRATAELEEGDTLETARAVIAKDLQALWAKEVIEELRLVHKRRAGAEVKGDTLPQLMPAFKELVKSNG